MAETGGNQLEQDIARIEQELATKREALEQQKDSGAIHEMPQERETLHEVVRQRIAATPAPTPTPTAPTDSAVPVQLQQKVQALVNTAFLKSIDEAIKEAKATNNAALIDAFHDLLVDELYTHLVERGKLKAM